LGADRAESKIKFLRKAELLETGGLPLLVTCLCTTNITALDLSANVVTEDGNDVGLAAIFDALTDDISGMGTLLRLDMSNNNINRHVKGEAAAVPGKALSDALAANTVLTELDLSNNYLKPEFARELAVGIQDNNAMMSLNLSCNELGAEGAKHIAA
jgi:Ran GTPase-activating protein (RanGAP) involved in mRNA processing and transport